MIQDLKKIFRRLTPVELAAKELAEAERALLEAQTGREYADAIVTYNEKRIARLRGVLKKQGEKT